RVNSRPLSFHDCITALGVPHRFKWGTTLKTLISVGSKTLLVFLAGVAVIGSGTRSAAQTAPSSDSNSATQLPPVTVESPKPRTQSGGTGRAGRSMHTTARRAAPRQRNTEATQTAHTETAASVGTFRQANGPIDGYVAHRSLVGTKTNTPIIEVPQAISVIGREQIRDQGAQSVVQALGYTAGVTTNSPNDT